uniref:VWFA domain-containing protein n=1 Tax=Panagrolaimus davidi TaxID=227884 RepID=A0A914P9P3_9BILA
MSKRELNALSAELSTYMHNFTFAQTGNHTVRAAIIGYASDVTTYYQLTDTTNYDAFVDALFDFADHGNSDDTGGNLQGALQQAYSLLQSQKSQRRQLIVLVAATYNPIGFQGADVTANSIKENGICIVVINYKSSQGVLATALQNISCPGYYYISDDDDLNLKFTYALTQLNCICPPGSLQFREYNTAWKNYTNYGDCLFGFNENTDPAMAQRSCHPGVLVAVTNEKKMFTIGLHKSASDNEWKCTEYSFGDFPSMTAASSVNDNYGYLWNNYGFNWTLQTGNNVALPYICQIRACDAEYICDQTQTKNLKHKIAFEV